MDLQVQQVLGYYFDRLVLLAPAFSLSGKTCPRPSAGSRWKRLVQPPRVLTRG
jgi:hypothetical protein